MPRATRKDERRREIARSAAALFDAAGLHATNMEMVAHAAGLQKPSLYHYFTSKDEILYEIHDEFIELLLDRDARRSDGDPTAEASLRGVVRDVLELMETHHGHVRVFFEHHRELSSERRRPIVEKRNRYRARIEAHVQRGIDQGVFRAADPELATLALFGMCNWAYQWYRPDGRLPVGAIADGFFDLLVVGLRLPERRAQANGEGD